MKNKVENDIQSALKAHKGYSQVFQQDKLTFGFIAPIAGYPNGPIPNMNIFEKVVRQADESGVDVIWLRDVPFLDPSFGDAGQVYDPMVYGGLLAGMTKRIAIGTAGIVLPLRDPVIVTKQAATLDQLSGGRFILGLSSGDRSSEYPAFGSNYDNRAERYREATGIIKKLTEESFPSFNTEFYGQFNGSIDLIPKPLGHHIPTIAIGRAGQSLEWIGENMDGWIWHGEPARHVALRRKHWNEATNGIDKPYGYAHFFDLSENPEEALSFGPNYIGGGRKALIDFWAQQQQAGLSHAVLNPKPTLRPADEMIQEFGEYIIPQFR
ncbi:LLM class oxidoreductase [Flavobacterium branchiicola]|uniref:LLM class oxidoreductase n=1 Tax=Flavobacterium branchiicola TaxID=1114875 RepID=A0ABV9PBQ0_9FLAO|nr:LLM class oxidoreductase [Flavobacterium branchiicola]MBS7254013.1 LLM class oxidoreductase [Flavobacterium branchiicola]